MSSNLFEIPKHWKWVTLDDIGIVVSGGTPSTKEPEFWNGNIPWITPADLSSHQEVYIGKGSRNISQTGLDYSSAYLLPENSVVFSSRAPIGYVAITKNNLATNQGFKNLILPSELVNPKYVYYYLKTVKELAESMASGTTFLELSASKFKQIPFPLAPIEEQNRIVEKIEETFSYVNDSLNNINQSLLTAKLYIEKNIYKLFRGNLLQNDDILGKLPEKWEWKTLNDIGKIYSGGTPKTKIKEYWGEEIAWITPSDLSNYKDKYISKGKKSITHLGLINSSAKKLPKDTILFSSRAPVGYVVIAKNELTTNQGFKAIVPNKEINPSYVYYFLKSIGEYANKIASGTTFLELSMEKFKSIPIPIPPFEEQNEIIIQIENIITETENLVNDIDIQKIKILNSKEKILLDAFCGKLINFFNTDSLVAPLYDDIKKAKKEFLTKQIEITKKRPKSIKIKYELKDIIHSKFGKTFFRFEDLVELNIFSTAQLSEQWNKLLDEGYIKKSYNLKTKQIQFNRHED